MFLFDLLNGNVDYPEIFSILGFHTSLIIFRVNKLLFVQFFTTYYSSSSYCLEVLMIANKIVNIVEVFKSNVCYTLSNSVS